MTIETKVTLSDLIEQLVRVAPMHSKLVEKFANGRLSDENMKNHPIVQEVARLHEELSHFSILDRLKFAEQFDGLPLERDIFFGPIGRELAETLNAYMEDEIIDFSTTRQTIGQTDQTNEDVEFDVVFAFQTVGGISLSSEKKDDEDGNDPG